MQADFEPGVSKLQRAVVFLLYLAGGVLVFYYGSNTFRIAATNRNPVYEWGMTAIFMALAVILRSSAGLRKFWKLAFALGAAMCANAVNLHLGNWLKEYLPAGGSEMQLLAVDKVAQAVPVVLTIVLLTLISGDSLGSIFVQKGNLRQGLTIGLVSFGFFSLLFIGIALLQSGETSSQGLFAAGISLEAIVAAIPWILLFVFSNGFMEELWYRGLSLGKLQPILKATATVVVTTLVFGISHLGATYVTPVEKYIFAMIVFLLGVINGFIMLKAKSIWGSVFFHAGYDLLVIIPVLAASG